jgi:hypothetical protein
MADDDGDAAFEAAVDTGIQEAETSFASAEADGNWVNWRAADPSAVPPWWEAGADWVWTVLRAGGFWNTLTVATYRQETKEAIDMLSRGVFERLLKPHQDRAFGRYAPDLKEVFANYVHVRLLPRVTERVLRPIAKKRAEGPTMTEVSARVVTPAKRYSRTIGTRAAAKRMEKYLERRGISMTDFAGTVGTTDRTLRKFRQTGRINRDTFDAIAKQMGLSRDELLNPGQ